MITNISKKLLMFICLLTMPIMVTSNTFFVQDNDFKFNIKKHNQFFIPVTIGHEKFLFAWNLGATTSIIDRKLANKLFRNSINKNNKIIAKNKPFHLKIGNNDILLDSLFVTDLSKSIKYLGKNIQGFIGLDVIRRFIWNIDFENNQIIMSDSIKLTDANKCVTMQDTSRELFFKIVYDTNHKLNDNSPTIDFILNNDIMNNQVHTSVARDLRASKSTQENTLYKESPNFYKNSKNKIVIYDTISNIKDLYFSINDNNTNQTFESIILSDVNINDDFNMLGQSFFEQFSKIVLNPYEMQFCFKKDPNAKFLNQIRNIAINMDDNNQIIINDGNNPKYLNKLSLKNKDIIISMNGKKIMPDDLLELNYILQYQPNLNLVIQRDNKLIKLNLK